MHIALYRITQEALNNIVKHARAHQVTVRLCFSRDDRVVDSQKKGGARAIPAGLSLALSISDDGRGFDPAHVAQDRLGVGIMRERAQSIGATFTIESQPGHGTRLTVLWKQASEQEAK